MEWAYKWIGNLTGFLLFMAVLDQLLPGKQYSRYVRLFSGMVLILLVFQPLTQATGAADRMAAWYETFAYQYQAGEFNRRLLGAERERMKQITKRYEEAVEENVKQMAAELGLEAVSCQAEISGEEGTAEFGTVKRISLQLAEKKTAMKEEGEEEKETERQPVAVVVEPVRISGEESWREETQQPGSGGRESGTPGGKGEQEERADGGPSDGGTMGRQEERGETGRLRSRISSYYGLEEDYVEIQIAEGKR